MCLTISAFVWQVGLLFAIADGFWTFWTIVDWTWRAIIAGPWMVPGNRVKRIERRCPVRVKEVDLEAQISPPPTTLGE
jgi:hypothetical protein